MGISLQDEIGREFLLEFRVHKFPGNFPGNFGVGNFVTGANCKGISVGISEQYKAKKFPGNFPGNFGVGNCVAVGSSQGILGPISSLGTSQGTSVLGISWQ